MANAVVYVDSTATGSGTGASWTNAFTTLVAAIAASGTTGTDFYVSSGHAEGASAALTFSFKGASATPDRVFSVDKTNSPPQIGDLTYGAQLNTSSGGLSITGNVYIYGCITQCVGQSNLSTTAPSDVYLDNCKLILATGNVLALGISSGTNSSRVVMNNTPIKCGGTNVLLRPGGGLIRWMNTPSAIDTGGSLPVTLIETSSANNGALFFLEGVDLSALTGKTLVNAFAGFAIIQFINCALPSSYTISNPTQPGAAIIDIVVSDGTATNYNQWRWAYQGTLSVNTSIYNSASDGATPVSWQVSASGGANPQSPFDCFEVIRWAPAGTYAATGVQLTSATASLTTNDVWVDVEYLGASYPLASQASTRGAGSGSATVPQMPQGSSPGALSTAGSWAVGGAGHNYVLAVPSFTTSVAGYVRFKIKVGKSGLTVYIDPNVVVA